MMLQSFHDGRIRIEPNGPDKPLHYFGIIEFRDKCIYLGNIRTKRFYTRRLLGQMHFYLYKLNLVSQKNWRYVQRGKEKVNVQDQMTVKRPTKPNHDGMPNIQPKNPHKELSMKAFKRELSLVAMKYVPPTSVQLTLLDQ